MSRRFDGDCPIRVGLVGHGDAGARLHGPLIEAAGDYRIVAVSTSRPETLHARWDSPRWAPDANALIAADDVDLVVLATPNETHHRYAKAALEAGKAVVVEKPFVTHPAMARDLIALAERRGALVSVFHNRRLDADYQLVRQTIDAGVLGRLTSFEARWDRPMGEAARGWRARAASGGGAHWDLGAHLVDQCLQLFGEPASMRGELARARDPALAPGGFNLELRYDGIAARLSAGLVRGTPRPRFVVKGSEGVLTVRSAEPWADAVGRDRHPAYPGFWDNISVQAAILDVGGVRRSVEVGYPQWDRFYPALATALRAGTEPQVTADQAARVVEILHALEAGVVA